MSWFLVIKGRIKQDDIKKLSRVVPDDDIKINKENLILALGGNPDTMLFNSRGKVLAIAGVPVITHEDNYRFAQITDFENCFTSSDNEILPEGHFAAVSISENVVKVFTDRLGIKELYYSKIENKIIISTRLDFISELIGEAELNYQNLGSRWLLNSQFGKKSIFTNIKRVSSAFITIDNKLNVSRRDISFKPKKTGNIKPEDFINEISKCLQLPADSGKKTIFAMSGGMDSRFLFSLIKDFENLSLFNDAEKTHPDFSAAKRISDKFGLRIFELIDDDHEKGFDNRG